MSLIPNVNLSAGMTGYAGNGSTYIKNPITVASRLKQRRESEQNQNA
jgi:hypothetical protein